MTLKFPRLFPERKISAPGPGVLPAAPGSILAAARHTALWAITLVITAATVAALAESYHALYLWAIHHGVIGGWAVAFPLFVDAFIIVGELVVLVGTIEGWTWLARTEAWAVSVIGLAVSVAGNIGHVAAHDIQSRGTAAIPPVAAFGALWLGMRVLKRVLSRPAHATGPAAPEQEIPADKVHAAKMAFAASHAAQNPISQNALIERFGLTRSVAQAVRKEVTDSP